MDKLQSYWKRAWIKIRQLSERQREKGQSLVLLAVMLIVLLLFAGMALDAGLIYMRRIQLSRAVDAAALACVGELPDMDATTERAEQFMRANGLDPDTVLAEFIVDNQPPTGIPTGVGQDNVASVYAKWRSNTVFMQLIGIPFVDLTATAAAEYRAYVDLYTSQTGESGKAGPVNLSIFGPDQTPSFGDACSCPAKHQSGSANYRPTVDGFIEANPNRDQWNACWPDGYPFRVHVPASINQLRIEILDPETYNNSVSSVFITNTLPVTSTDGFWWNVSPTNRSNPAMYKWFESAIGEDRYWIQRMDENRRYNTTPTYNNAYNTDTAFRLYYISDGARVNIATYTARKDNANNTDLMWICPGGSAASDPQYGAPNVDLVGHGGDYFLTPNPSFEIDMAKLDGIQAGDDGSRSLFLEVESLSGWSENGFDLWAGPATTDNIDYWGGQRAEVNARNLWIDRRRALGEQNPHDSGGATVYGRGILPLNVNTDVTYEVTLAYIPEAARGIDLCIYKWDTDIGSESVCYWFDGYPVPGEAGTHCNEGEVQGVLSGGNSWTVDYGNYNFPEGCDTVSIPEDFIGGYVHARYKMNAHDTSTWLMEYQQPVPGSSYVRLIQ
jgi:Flp pilus assembly protein TadG